LFPAFLSHGKSCTRCAASKKTSRPSLGPCPLLGLSDSSKGAKSPRKGKGVKKEGYTDSEALTEPDTSEDEGERSKGTLVPGKKEEITGLELSEEAKEQARKDIEESVRIAHGG